MNSKPTTTAAKVREYIRENLLYGSDQAIGDGDSLLDAGVIDSTGAMDLVTYLESEFGITVDDRDLVPENLDSIGAICAFIQRKQDERNAAPARIAGSA